MSKKVLTNTFIFVMGGIIGSLITLQYTKTKIDELEKLKEDEIESVKQSFSKREDNIKEQAENIINDSQYSLFDQKSSETITSQEVVKKVDYSKGTVTEIVKEEKQMAKEPSIYVIEPIECGEDGYDVDSLHYYQNGVVTDEQNNVLSDEDIENTIGKDSLEHFGEFEDDSVYVRNDNLKKDYEILLQPEEFDIS